MLCTTIIWEILQGSNTVPWALMIRFSAEAFALLRLLEHCESEGLVQRGEAIHIFYDCKTMVKAIHSNDFNELPSWRATEIIAVCARILQKWGELCTLRHTRQELTEPHNLANMARRNESDFDGNPWHGNMMGITLSPCLDERWFYISN